MCFVKLLSVEGTEVCWCPHRMSAVDALTTNLVLPEHPKPRQEDLAALEWHPRAQVLQQKPNAPRQAHQEEAEAKREGPHQGQIELCLSVLHFGPSNTDRRNLIACNQKHNEACNKCTGTHRHPGLAMATAATHNRMLEFKV